jgi:lipopolysaccharide transport system permease protein
MLATDSIPTKKEGFLDTLIPGIQDFRAGLKMWRMFLYLGWEDIRQRYVRTVLGPLWMILGTAIWIGVMGFVMASLFGGKLSDALPYISAGTVLWTFIASTMNDGCMLYIHSASVVHAINLPMSVHVFRFVSKNFIMFLHNLLILLVVFIFCHVNVNLNTLYVIPGLILFMINVTWVSTLLGLFNARYRDVQQIIITSMTVLPFITPIFWERAFLKKHFWIANINPFYHAIEIVRGPLLGRELNVLSWEVMIGITVIGLLLTMRVFSRFKHKIIFWI